MVNAPKQLEYLISNVVKYGKLFIESDAGRNWEHLGTGSINSERLPWWATFYTELKNGEFIDFTEKLLAHPVNNYQKGEILNEIKELYYKIKELDPANWNNTPLDKLKTSIATKPEVVEKFRKQFEYLVAQDVIDKYTWKKDDVIAINPVNDVFKAIILEGYFSIIDHYENFEANRIKELEQRLREYENTIYIYKKDLKKLNEVVRALKDENNALKKKNREGNQIDEINIDALSSNDREKMMLLYRLGLLEHSVWPEGAKFDDVALMMSKFVNMKVTSLVRLRKAFLNNDDLGEAIISIHDAKIKESINAIFPEIDLEKQKFLMVLEKSHKIQKK